MQILVQRLVEQIKYKAKLVGVEVKLQKEYYTSGVSAYDLEPITKKYYNKNRRIKRGLFNPEIVGWVTSCGYKCEIKPNSYTASGIANKFSK